MPFISYAHNYEDAILWRRLGAGLRDAGDHAEGLEKLREVARSETADFHKALRAEEGK